MHRLKWMIAPHQMLDIFRKAQQGDTHYQAVCARYSRMIKGAYEQQRAEGVYEEEMVRQVIFLRPE